MVDGVLIKQIGRDDLLDDFLKDLGTEIGGGDFLGVLGGNDDGVDPQRDGSTTILLVLDGDLGLRVGAEPGKGAGATSNSHGGVELVGKHDGEGHQLLGLVCRVSEHDTLVTGTVILERAVVETLGDIGRLLLDRDENVAGLVVEALGRVVVANLLNGLADNLLVVDLGLGGDFTENHDHAGLGGGLAGDLGGRVFPEASIELLSYSIQKVENNHAGCSRWRLRPGHRSYLRNCKIPLRWQSSQKNIPG